MVRGKRKIICLLIIGLLISGCGKAEQQAPVEENSENEDTERKYYFEIYEKWPNRDTVMVKATAFRPYFGDILEGEALEEVEEYYDRKYGEYAQEWEEMIGYETEREKRWDGEGDFLYQTNHGVMNYRIELVSNDLVSVRRTYDSYSAGAAHGNDKVLGDTFDRSTGRVISLDSLFKDEQGKEALFNEVMAELRDMSEANPLFYSGDALEQAAEKCFGDVEFYLTSKGIVIVFDKYTLGVSALEPQEVLIAYYRLDDVWSEWFASMDKG